MSHDLQTANLNVQGNPDAEVLVVVDAPLSAVYAQGLVMPEAAMTMFGKVAESVGLHASQFAFVTPCPPMPPTVTGSMKRESDHLKKYQDELKSLISEFPKHKLLVTLGAAASKQVLNRAVAMMKTRGQVLNETGWNVPILPLLTPGHVFRRPELQEIFETDFRVLGVLNKHGWNPKVLEQQEKKADYQYCFDLSAWLKNKPKGIAVDIESKGGRWYSPRFKVLCVQLTRRSGQSLVVPINRQWFNQKDNVETVELSKETRTMLIEQLKELLEDPKVACTGSNLVSDILGLEKYLGIKIANWHHDTQQLAFVCDENMLEKSLAEVTRRWVPEMSGYSDEFDREVDKEHMEKVLPSKMLPYAGGDPDASFRSTRRLVKIGMEDERNWWCYRKIQMPALRMFAKTERRGIRIDRNALRELGRTLKEDVEKRYCDLIAQVPNSIKQKHVDVGLKFSRDMLLIDILFDHPDGFRLEPIVFTKGTKNLNGADRKPSVSLKNHLPFFEHVPFVRGLIEYQKMRHVLEKYIGDEGGILIPSKRKNAVKRYTKPTGFWQYLVDGDRIHPSFFLHRTVTGRTSSANPNAQNLPKRGKLATAFRRIFIPSEGYTFIEADLSQAELRIAAWMAQEPNMLRIYREGGDIHEATAAAVMGVPLEEFGQWKESNVPIPLSLQKGARDCDTLGDLYDLKRYQAKAVNFGFIYGMGWRKFMIYAKTDYGLDFTEEESKAVRGAFFALYPLLAVWHQQMREFVREHGYVRSLHGALRRLPNIRSNDEAVKQESERQGINSPVQRFASDIGLMGLIRFDRDADEEIMRNVAFIHDSGVIEAKIGHEQEAMQSLKFYMESAPLWEWFGVQPPIPLVSDVKFSKSSLGEMEEQHVEALQPDWYRKELDHDHS